jgi:hypothetical protein
LDPVTKLKYLEAAWEKKYIDMGKKWLEEQVRFYVTWFFIFICIFSVPHLQGSI